MISLKRKRCVVAKQENKTALRKKSIYDLALFFALARTKGRYNITAFSLALASI